MATFCYAEFAKAVKQKRNHYERYRTGLSYLAGAEVAAYGRCDAKAMQHYGCKLHTLISDMGLVMDFALSAANHYDNQIVPEFMVLYAHRDILEEVTGDKAYNDHRLRVNLFKEFGIQLKALKKDNQAVEEAAHPCRTRGLGVGTRTKRRYSQDVICTLIMLIKADRLPIF